MLKEKLKIFPPLKKLTNEFDKMFSQVYTEFYKRLNKVAKLSQTDLRLASYIKDESHQLMRFLESLVFH